QVLGEGLPAPLDALVQCGTGDVLDAFHQLDEALLATRAHRREAHAAVADDDGGHAVARRRLEHRVPRGLSVVVRVDVDEAGRDNEPRRVDDLNRVALDGRADFDDHTVLDRDVADELRATRSVDDGPPADLQIEHQRIVYKIYRRKRS